MACVTRAQIAWILLLILYRVSLAAAEVDEEDDLEADQIDKTPISAADMALSPKLINETFDEFIQNGGPVAVKFFSPYCVHCSIFAPKWVAVCRRIKEEGVAMRTAEVDVIDQRELSRQFDIESYPTICVLHEGKVYKYEGAWNEESVAKFLRSDWKKAKSARNLRVNIASSPGWTKSFFIMIAIGGGVWVFLRRYGRTLTRRVNGYYKLPTRRVHS